MNLIDAIIPEYAHEMNLTRRVLERVPEDKWSWTPHEKSMPMGRLASHIAEIQAWTAPAMNQDSMDLTGYKPFEAEPGGSLLAAFDKSVAEAKEAMQGTGNEALMAPWKLTSDGQTIIEMPRAAVLRGFIISHTIHHRGQIGVYLRLNGIPLPSLYGPSADEQS